MHEILKKYIEDHSSAPLSAKEFEEIRNLFTPKKIRRKQYLLQEGDVCKHLSFITQGAMRQYTVDEKGAEHIVRFGIERWWMADRESFEMSTPSRYNIDAWEESHLLQITNPHLRQLENSIAAFKELVNALEKRGYIAAQRRIHAAISYTAEERYLDLGKTNPEFLQRFPQNMIASYLGISAETLSRIRKQALSK